MMKKRLCSNIRFEVFTKNLKETVIFEKKGSNFFKIFAFTGNTISYTLKPNLTLQKHGFENLQQLTR